MHLKRDTSFRVLFQSDIAMLVATRTTFHRCVVRYAVISWCNQFTYKRPLGLLIDIISLLQRSPTPAVQTHVTMTSVRNATSNGVLRVKFDTTNVVLR